MTSRGWTHKAPVPWVMYAARDKPSIVRVSSYMGGALVVDEYGSEDGMLVVDYHDANTRWFGPLEAPP